MNTVSLLFSVGEKDYYIYKILSFRKQPGAHGLLEQLSLYTGRAKRICAKFLHSYHMCFKNIITYFDFIVQSTSKSWRVDVARGGGQRGLEPSLRDRPS